MLSHKRSQEKGKQLNALEVQKQLESFEHHAIEGSQKKGSRQSQKKWSKNQEASKDNMRSVNQRLVAPAGCSGKKPGRKHDICSRRLKPVLRRKWGRERNQAQHHSPSSSGREKLHLGSEKTFCLDGPSFSRRTTLKQSQLCELSPSFLPTPSGSKNWGPESGHYKHLHMESVSTEETYISESKHREWLAEDRSKI